MSYKGGNCTLHFYVKKGPINKMRNRKLIKDKDTLDNQVMIAFQKLKGFQQISDKTNRKIMEFIHPLELAIQLTENKRNLTRIS